MNDYLAFNACSVCSHPPLIVRPDWHFARHSSLKRKKNLWLVTACEHWMYSKQDVELIDDTQKESIVACWNAHTLVLLEKRCEHLTEAQKHKLIRGLGYENQGSNQAAGA